MNDLLQPANTVLTYLEQKKYNLQGPKILLEGPSGTGKTYALGKLVDWAQKHNKKVYILFTENGLETLLGYWRDRQLAVPDNLYWHVSMTRPLTMTNLMKSAEDLRLSYELLTKLQDPKKGGVDSAMYKIYSACNNFIDDNTGTTHGSIETFDNDSIFVIDSLSELANATSKAVIGTKIVMSQPEYLLAQNNLMNFLRLCTQGINCTFVLTAHIDRQTDDITSATKLMTKAIGKAISGEIPQLFSDVILTVREGGNFYWDTAHAQTDLKTRNLPIQSKLAPDFALIMDKWLQRQQIK